MTSEDVQINQELSQIEQELKSTRRIMTHNDICNLPGIHSRLEPNGLLFQKILKDEKIEYDKEKKTFRYKPKCVAHNIDDLIEKIRQADYRGVKSSDLDDAYINVESDLTELKTHPEAHGIVALKDDKKGRSEFYFYNDPTKTIPDLKKPEPEIISSWKKNDSNATEEFYKVVKDSQFVRYHFTNSDKRKKRDP
ncbi:TFIIE beta domain-containing protein [Entamoeba marina]